MRIKKYNEFLVNEDTDPFNDSPEVYIDIVLGKLKKKIDSMFDAEPSKNASIEQTPEQAKVNKKDNKATFSELGLKLESSEISKYSKLYDSLTVKFSDEACMYHLFVMMKLEDAIAKDPGTEVEQEKVDEAYIVFKKYDIQSLDMIGQIHKNINTDNITQDYIVDLKLELDEEFGEEDEEFSIET